MTTPEGKTKKLIDKLLANHGIIPASKAGAGMDGVGWYYMPVQSLYAVKGVPDYIGHYYGVFFGVEAKARGKEPTGFQQVQIDEIIITGGAVFVIDGSEESLAVFERWLGRCRQLNGRGE